MKTARIYINGATLAAAPEIAGSRNSKRCCALGKIKTQPGCTILVKFLGTHHELCVLIACLSTGDIVSMGGRMHGTRTQYFACWARDVKVMP
jgi:hypothetical protein